MEQLIKIFVNFTKLGLSKFEEKKLNARTEKHFITKNLKLFSI